MKTTLSVRNPRTGMDDYSIPCASSDEVAQVCKDLRTAQPRWANLSLDERITAMLAFADALEKGSGKIVQELAIDTGRQAIAGVEVFGVVGAIRQWAEKVLPIHEELVTSHRPSAFPGITAKMAPVPYSLFGAISPWNFPFLLSMVDAIPALFAGCAAIIKPSEVTPRFIEPVRDACAQVNHLADVLAFVTGDAETGKAVVANVDFICFTGSVATGRKVAEAAARAFIPANLELGGNDPMIVTASADPAEAARIALRSSCVATGQTCQSIERIYVARDIYEDFVEHLVSQSEAIRLNYPKIDQGEIGPFIFEGQAQKVREQLANAVSMGARILTGGEVERLGGGLYLRPTVITNVTRQMDIVRHETFGPVMPVIPFDDLEEAIAAANDTEYGLSASVISEDIAEAEWVGRALEAGAISINDGSLTGMVNDIENMAFKHSGLGPSRMGDSGYTRFFRMKALIQQNARSMGLPDFAEDANQG